MFTRLTLVLTALWALGLEGPPSDPQARYRQEVRRLCEGRWYIACARRIEERRMEFDRGLARSGYSPDHLAASSLFLAAVEAETLYGIDHKLLSAVALAESSLRADAVSNKGAQGILQIQPQTARHLWPRFLATLAPNDPLIDADPVVEARDIRLNVLLGAFYLSHLQKRFGGNESLALASYNMGPGAVDRQLTGDLAAPVGTKYVRRIREFLRNFDAVLPARAGRSPAI